jgi:NADPH:quinone reductase-like Zn-dependent oxidoreductase
MTGVCSTKNAGMVRSIGADHVIDYTSEDFTRNGRRYDLILDNVANHSLSDTRRVLTSAGRLQSNNGTAGGRWFGTMGTVIKTAAVSNARQAPAGPPHQIREPKGPRGPEGTHREEGKVRPVIDMTYPLSRTPEAIGHVGEGHARGTVVITMNGADHA